MSRSLDDEDSTDGWGDNPGAGWALAFLVVGVAVLGVFVYVLGSR